MNLDKGDTLVAIKRIPKIEGAAESETADGRRGAEAGMERSVMTANRDYNDLPQSAKSVQ